MAQIISLLGRWRVIVKSKDAGYAQQFVITGSSNTDGEHTGIVGNGVLVEGKAQLPWNISIQHNDGSGWINSELRESLRVTKGSDITFDIESEDNLSPESDWDYNDLILHIEKVGMIEIPFRPYAIRTETFQMMPDGIFETTLGIYYMGVKVKNIWTQSLPTGSMIGISNLGKNMLAKGGIKVIDTWTVEELETLGQQMVSGKVVLGSLAPWEVKTVYFKVDCKDGQPHKHSIQFEVVNTGMPDPDNPNRKGNQMIFVTHSEFHSNTKEFVCECDNGKLFLKLKELAVEYTTLRDAVICAREHFKKYGLPLEERARKMLTDLMDGNKVDLCELKKIFESACREEGEQGWGNNWSCGNILMYPTKFDYRVVPNSKYNGQFGPIPFDDPWWKVLLKIIAAIVSTLAGLTAAMDLIYGSDYIVIGTLFDSKRVLDDSGEFYFLDAALCKLNGSREPSGKEPFLQILNVQSDEPNQVPISKSKDSSIIINDQTGTVTLTGEYLTVKEIDELTTAYKKSPKNEEDIDKVRVFKSGMRTGVTHGVMTDLVKYKLTDSKGKEQTAKEHVVIEPIPAYYSGPALQYISNRGDSGSVWIHYQTGKLVALHRGGNDGKTASGAPIQHIVEKMNISFKKPII